jgi:hypothetical protein
MPHFDCTDNELSTRKCSRNETWPWPRTWRSLTPSPRRSTRSYCNLPNLTVTTFHITKKYQKNNRCLKHTPFHIVLISKRALTHELHTFGLSVSDQPLNAKLNLDLPSFLKPPLSLFRNVLPGDKSPFLFGQIVFSCTVYLGLFRITQIVQIFTGHQITIHPAL